MSISTTSPPQAHGASLGFLRIIGTALARCWFALVERRLHRLVSADLHAMSDRGLKDIGLSRSEIETAIRGADPLTPRYLRGRHY